MIVMNENKIISTDLTGQLLVAMPNMQDERFSKSVIYICSHTQEGAMGLMINRVIPTLTFPDLLHQLDIQTYGMENEIRVHLGGPVDEERGFVLHSPDYIKDSTVIVGSKFALTATVDILRDMASGEGPAQSLLALGYAGWGPGQLDQEMLENGWLSVPADDAIVYDNQMETKWERAMGQLGIDPRLLLDEAGHA